MIHHRSSWFALLAALGLFATASLVAAAEPAADKAAGHANEDLYKVPDGDSEALFDFIDNLKNYRPNSREEYVSHRANSLKAIKAAAEKIAAQEKDKDSDNAKKAQEMLFQVRALTLDSATAAEQEQFVTDVKKRFAGKELGREDISFLRQIASTAEFGGNQKLAGKLYGTFAEMLSKSTNPQVEMYGKMFAGAARRMNLIGNQIELKGTLVDGKPFDWASYRGKVVLIDFWATWCGPCRAEMPNVKANYEKYHAQGFDVVGISLDEDTDKLKAFLETEKTPWATIHEADGFKSELPSYYGIMGIPTVLLADKEGKIVSLNARGPELGKLLEQLLGPAKTAAN